MKFARTLFLSVTIPLLASCGGGGSTSVQSGYVYGGGTTSGAAPTLADRVRGLVLGLGMDGDPANGLRQVKPSQDSMVKLGEDLFFSRTLSGRMDVACASCHDPRLGGGDDLSLAVGVFAKDPSIIGLGREVDPTLDVSPRADGGPNVPRNSQTILNSALYDRSMFHDGRVYVLDSTDQQGGVGQNIRTPESGNGTDSGAGGSLLAAQAKMPIVGNNEMRGYTYPALGSPTYYRQHLVDRLRGNVDQSYLSANAAANWQTLFDNAFGASSGSSNITMLNIQKAIAAYERSMIFVNSPWKRFVQGDNSALSGAALDGALLFFTSKANGGLGCFSCHGGDHFTDEKYYNVGFPQIGRGKRTDNSDHGRAGVNVNTETDLNKYAFRVPSLLNVGLTAPYGHDGAFATLSAVLQYHADPRKAVNSYEFDLKQLPQVSLYPNFDGTVQYPNSKTLTEDAIAASSFSQAESLLPKRSLTGTEINDLVAFLDSLTDDCASDMSCISQWVPTSASDNPDGNLLVRGASFTVPQIPQQNSYPAQVSLNFPSLPALSGFASTQNCSTTPSAVANTGANAFVEKDQSLGLTGSNGYSINTWLASADSSTFQLDETMESGGLSAGYLTGSCWPDLIFTGGDGPGASGVVLYRNLGDQNGFVADNIFDNVPTSPNTGVAIADLNGDYRPELLFGNLHQGDLPVYSLNSSGMYTKVADLPMGRSTFGMAFGDPMGGGYPQMYLSHWSPNGVPGSAPAFWTNPDGKTLVPSDASAGTGSNVITQNKNFSPGFADFNQDGLPDLVVASDLDTSVVMQNNGDGTFSNVTDRQVINDSNGMGAAIGDFDNDGRLDWFVDSVYMQGDTSGTYGNRLYWNRSTPGGSIVFKRAPDTAGMAAGGWAWGSCAADFNNDGWLDIFQVDGFGKTPSYILGYGADDVINAYNTLFNSFQDQASHLYINNGDGTFTDEAKAWGLDAVSEGRGVVCFDYDRDGDIDVGLVNNSGSNGIQFFENQTGHGAGAGFLNVRLEGNSPNTEALGAEVTVTADLNNDGVISSNEQQIRVSSANSNFISQNLPDMHFGLGSATTVAKLRVRWPDGTAESCTNVPINRFMIVRQKDGLICP